MPWAGHQDRASYAAAIANWTPYLVPDDAEDDDGDRDWETPWDPGAPPLHLVKRRDRQRFLGPIPTRREIIAGQVERALERLGADATLGEIAASVALWWGDPEFLAVMFGARVEVVPDGRRSPILRNVTHEYLARPTVK